MGESSRAVGPTALRLILPVLVNVRIFMYLRQLNVEQAFGLYDASLPTGGFTNHK